MLLDVSLIFKEIRSLFLPTWITNTYQILYADKYFNGLSRSIRIDKSNQT